MFRRFVLLTLLILMAVTTFGCGGGGQPEGEGELLTENPRARHYDQDPELLDESGADEASGQETQDQ